MPPPNPVPTPVPPGSTGTPPWHSRLSTMRGSQQPAVPNQCRPAEEAGEEEQTDLPGLGIGIAWHGPDGSCVCPTVPCRGRGGGWIRARWRSSTQGGRVGGPRGGVCVSGQVGVRVEAALTWQERNQGTAQCQSQPHDPQASCKILQPVNLSFFMGRRHLLPPLWGRPHD